MTLPCGMAALLLTLFPVVPWRDMVSLQEATPWWPCTWHTHPAGMDPQQWQARAMVSYLSWVLLTGGVTWGQWWDRVLGWARDGGSVATYPDLPREPMAVQPWSLSQHLPTVAAQLAAVDPEVRSLEEEPGFRLGLGMEVRSVCLPSPMTPELLEGLSFTRSDEAEVWTAVHRQLRGSWDASLQPPGCDWLVGVKWRLWAANGPCPPMVMWPRHSGPGPRCETIMVLWGWVTIRGAGGHAFTAPRGTAMDSDGRVALQLTAEPLTTHVAAVSLHWGAERPQP